MAKDEIKVGQIWESTDPRDAGRRVKVVGLAGQQAIIENVVTRRRTFLSLGRLRHGLLNSIYYRLVEEES